MRKILACSLVLLGLLAGLSIASSSAEDAGKLAREYKINGSPMAQEEAYALVDRLEARIYLPARELNSFKCEFTPRFTELNLEKNPGLLKNAAFNLNFILFEGDLFYLLQEKPLLSAKKAVFYWDKNAGSMPGHSPAVVQLFDGEGKPLAVHPFVSKTLGLFCMQMLHLNTPSLLSLPRTSDPNFEIHSYLDTVGEDKIFTSLFKYDRPAMHEGKHITVFGDWNLLEVRFGNDGNPVSAGVKQWADKAKQWQWARSPYYFKKADKGDRVFISRMGRMPNASLYEWKNAGQGWAVGMARGYRENFEVAEKGHYLPWEYQFTNFQINPAIDPEVLAWPAPRPFKMDFSTPDATIQTIFNCLKNDRGDLLAYCTTHAPDKPMAERAPASYMGYLLDTNRGIAERIKIMEKMPYETLWLFHIQVPKLWMKQNLETSYKLTQVDGQWKLDGNFDDLDGALYD